MFRAFGFAAAVVGQRQEINHQAARRLFRKLFEQPIKCQPIGLAREQLLAIDEMEQRHRFAPQGMDDMAIVDDMAVLAGGGAPTRQGHQ